MHRVIDAHLRFHHIFLLFGAYRLDAKPHIAYLLRLLMDLSVTYFNIVRGIWNKQPRQLVSSTLLALIKVCQED